MTNLQNYAVIHRTEEQDVAIASIAAMSLEEAKAIFDVRHAGEKEAMENGEVMVIAEIEGEPVFDGNKRLIVTSGNMYMIHKF